MSPAQASLATILFTDIVGSTERAAQLRDRGWRDLRQEHDRRVRRELRRYGGREINTAGDSFLATFERPARAIACAGAIRAAARELGLEIRAGLHMGEVEGAGRELGGLALHIGARVMAAAAPGEILVSGSVHDALAGSAIDFEDRGVHPLKGVPGEWRLFAVTNVPAEASEGLPGRVRRTLTERRAMWAGAVIAALLLTGIVIARRDAGPDLTPEEALAADAAPGIAVLPFEARGQGLEFWRESAVDLLSTNLDGNGGLRAIHPRTILARWRERVPENAGSDLPTALEVARATGARYALVGSAVSLGRSVRLVADIYDLKEGESLGQVRVESAPDSLAALADRLSVEVLKLVLGSGTEDLRIDLAGVTTRSPVALRAYLEGEALFRRSRFDAAFAAYERAIDADSTFALALSRMTESCWWGIEIELCGEYMERAIRFIDRLPPRSVEILRAMNAIAVVDFDALAPLRQAVRRYPDDPQMAYMLGEFLYHLNEQLLLDQNDALPFLERSVRLDPTVAAYYEHLVDRAIVGTDSARAAALVERHGRAAAGSDHDRAYRLALALAFGDSATYRRTRAAMDTISTDVLFYAAGNCLGSPRMLSTQTEALRILRARPDFPAWAAMNSFTALLRQGRLRAAESALEDPLLSQDERNWGTYLLHRAGLDGATRRLDANLAVPPPDTALGIQRLLASGAYAADRGRWSDHAIVVQLARNEAQRQRSGGDSLAAHAYVGAARALEGYALWRRGRGAEAVPILESVQQGVRGDGIAWWLNAVVRSWLWEILVELDRPREALIYVRTFAAESEARFVSGQIYQQLGDHDRARTAYEDALVAWRNADPELEPRIQTARAALATLRNE